MQRIIAILFTIINCTIIYSCKKDKNQENIDDDPIPVSGIIKGKIILSANSKIDANTFRVESHIGSSPVINSEFNVKGDTSGFNSLLVLDGSNSLMLIGYYYPEQSDKNISVSTTAVALVMNTPAASSLSKEGKLTLINKIKSDPNIHELENAIEANLATSKDLFDSSNRDLFKKIEILLTNASHRRANSVLDPVLYTQSGKNFSFYNDGARVISSVVGIYKDKVRVEEIVVDGINLMPTSIADIINLDFAAVSDPPAPENYTLTGSGQYELRMRTGRPDAIENSKEFEEAFLLNIQKMSYEFMKIFLPAVKRSNLHCFSILAKAVYDRHKLYNYNIAALTLEVMKQTLEEAEKLEKCINGNSAMFNASYFPILKRFYDRLNMFFTPGTVFNQTLLGLQWLSIDASKDLCFITTENSINSCGPNFSANLNGSQWVPTGVYARLYRSNISIDAFSNDYLPASPYQGALQFEIPPAVGTYTKQVTFLLYPEMSEPGNGYRWVSNSVTITSFDNNVLKGTFNAMFLYKDISVNFTDGQFELLIQ